MAKGIFRLKDCINGDVVYTQQVSEIIYEPYYEEALATLKKMITNLF